MNEGIKKAQVRRDVYVAEGMAGIDLSIASLKNDVAFLLRELNRQLEVVDNAVASGDIDDLTVLNAKVDIMNSMRQLAKNTVVNESQYSLAATASHMAASLDDVLKNDFQVEEK